ncbi:MAG TPA: DUF3857 domain-containing protein, partial [Verrucomicrobiales bacterium]|nr:DUF3857 domain-containing protein [Verrucomicrobiales bacterium]
MLSRPFLLMALVAGLFLSPSGAQEVSWNPPPVYAQKMQRLLTPLEPLMKAAPSEEEKKGEGVVLIDEDLYLTAEDGKRILVEHFAALALTDSGAESLARTERYYQKSRHRMHVVLARTIQPDGKKQAVKKETVFIQTPQRNADDALYDDGAEAVLIFPNVKAGCAIEYITVCEETQTRIPGEYTAMYDFAGGWPVRRYVRRLEMPDALAARLRITPLGSGVPEPMSSREGGFTAWKWERSAAPALHAEAGHAPVDQRGPCVFLTTLPDWNAFLHWYVPLANRRMVADGKLKALVSEWTKDAKTPRESLDLITAKVAGEVRYAGLEFNECDLEPHAAPEVWEHQYGDCKDKASLLCTLLREKGITAHMALVNTEHTGRVERRSPDFRHFNHAICVAELPGGLVFIDPTISGAPAGMLSPSDTDREVLLVKEPEQWLRTPAQRAGSYHLDVDAAMAADGSLSGWVTLKGEGYIGNLYAEYERTGTKDQLRNRLTKHTEAAYPGARVVDVKPSQRNMATGHYEVQGYFTVPAAGSLTLGFPYSVKMLPNPGDTEGRQTDMTPWMEDTGTSSTITLPAGYTTQLPPPHEMESSFASARASWERTEKGLKATLEYKAKTARIPAADCAAFGRSVETLRTWITKPLTITVSDKAQAEMKKAVGEDGLGDFPVMPTGQGQLNFVEEKFPENGNQMLRRKAFEKALALFPRDAATQFNGAVRLAWIDIVEDKYEAALRRLKAPLETGRAAVSLEELRLGEYVNAIALTNLGKTEEALAIFDPMAVQEGVSNHRRSWAHYQRALIHKRGDRGKALAALKDGLALDGENAGSLLAVLADIRMQKDQSAEFKKELAAWLEKETDGQGEAMTLLAHTAREWITERPRDATALIGVLSSSGEASRFGETFSKALAAARLASQNAGVTAEISGELKKFLEEHPEGVPKAEVPEGLNEAEPYLVEMKKVMGADQNGAVSLAWALEFMRRFPASDQFPETLRKAVAFENVREDNAKATKPGILMREL